MAASEIAVPNLVCEGREAAKGRVARLEKSLADLNSSLEAAEARRAELGAERKAVNLAAKVERTAAAIKRKDAIDGDLARLQRDIEDDSAAISELTAQLEDAKKALAGAEWEQRKAELRAALRSRLEAETSRKLDAAVAAVAEALEEESTKDQSLSRALLQFDRDLREASRGIGLLAAFRGEIVVAKLRQFLPVGISAGDFKLRDRSICEESGRKYRQALENLDCLELPS